MRHDHFAKQQGLSLIELMIALALSSFLVLGLIQIYLSSKKNHQFQQEQLLQTDASHALLNILEAELLRTGYRRRPDMDFKQVFIESDDFAEGQVVLAKNNRFSIRYQASYAGQLTCAGVAATKQSIDQPYGSSNPEDSNALLEPTIVTISYDTNDKTLSCNDQVMLDDVQKFEVWFAVADPLTLTITQYTNQPAASDTVIGVKYKIRLASNHAKQAADDVMSTTINRTLSFRNLII